MSARSRVVCLWRSAPWTHTAGFSPPPTSSSLHLFESSKSQWLEALREEEKRGEELQPCTVLDLFSFFPFTKEEGREI